MITPICQAFHFHICEFHILLPSPIILTTLQKYLYKNELSARIQFKFDLHNVSLSIKKIYSLIQNQYLGNSYMALNQSIIFKENTQSNVQPRKTILEQYIVYGIPLRCSQDNTSIVTCVYIYTFIYT